MNFKGFIKSVAESLRTACMVLMLIAGSTLLGDFLAVTMIPMIAADWVVELPLNKYVIMIVMSLIISPGWYLALLQPDKITGLSYTLNESGEVQILRYSTTLLDWLATYSISKISAYVIYATAALLGFFITARAVYKEESILKLMAMVLLVNFALIPYALFYDYSALVLTLFFINSE